MKICSKCKRQLPISEFYKCKLSRDGLQYWCKECQCKWMGENKKPLKDSREYMQKYREEHPEYYQSQLEKNRLYKQMNKEKNKYKYRQQRRKHYERNKEIYIARMNKRRRDYGFIPLMDNPFPEEIKIEWHHINNLFVVPLPKVTHRYVYASMDSEKHRRLGNKMVEKLYGIDINELIGDVKK